jgi:outer membrane cobalamin receptor
MPYEVTGSLIRQRVERRGVIATTTSSPVTVIDAEAIRRCGASTVVDVLRKHGNR